MPHLWALPDDPLVPEVEAFARRYDVATRARTLDRSPRCPRDELRALSDAHLTGLTLPPSLGGRGLPPARAAALLFRLAYRGGTVFAKLSLQPEFCSVLGTHGGTALREEWWSPIVAGTKLVGNQLTEPGAGSDVNAIATVAEPTSGGYRLVGEKCDAAFAADADAAIVYARRPGTTGSAGISTFLVPQSLDGVVRTVDDPDLGERWQRRGRVRYEGTEIPAMLRIGAEGDGLTYVRPELARERGLLAAIYLGVARASWEETVAYVGQRRAFGRPLSDQEAVAFPLVEDGTRLEAAWRYTLGALERLAEDPASVGRTATAKAFACDVALTAIDHAIQFHGGRGYSGSLPHEQRWRDVRSGRIAHGASEALLKGVARELWAGGPGANP